MREVIFMFFFFPLYSIAPTLFSLTVFVSLTQSFLSLHVKDGDMRIFYINSYPPQAFDLLCEVNSIYTRSAQIKGFVH